MLLSVKDESILKIQILYAQKNDKLINEQYVEPRHLTAYGDYGLGFIYFD